jgi:P4 family phage/plasmid primase-like protien
MLLGLCLIPDVRYEVAFFLVGPAGSGKTVFLNILESLVGKENTCCIPLSKFKEKFSLHPLTEKLVDIVGDMPTSGADFSLAAMEGAFKDVISGGIMPCERKFQDAYEARSTARLVFATNSMPRFSDKSNGVWARIRIIPFNVVVRGTKVENNHIDDDIIANELPGILNKALKALANLKTLRAFPELEAGAKLKDKHRASCDPETEFLKDRFVLDKAASIPVADMQSMYNSHCKTNGISSKSANRLADALRALFPSVEKNRIRRSGTGERIYMWAGIRENKSSVTCEKLKASA